MSARLAAAGCAVLALLVSASDIRAQAPEAARLDSVMAGFAHQGFDPRPASPAGGLYSTTHDLALWEQMPYGGKLVSPRELARMTTPVRQDHACGIHHRLPPGREVIYHTGRVIGFESVLGYCPQDSLAVVVLSNLDGLRPNRVFDALAAAAHRRAP